MSPKIIQQLFRKYNFTSTKIRGQNFLVDDRVLESIVAAGQIKETDIILEIGPGFGFLTKLLAAKAKKVLALEIDTRAAAVLQDELNDFINVDIIVGDALAFDLKKYHLAEAAYLLIANIPYQITNKIFEKFLFGFCPPERAVLLMQREVGERILARDDRRGALAVVAQTAFTVNEVVRVSKEKFYPVPKVDSVVLAFEFSRALPKGFADFVHQGFAHPNKKAINNLTTLFSGAALKKALAELGIDLAARPGVIEPKMWLKLFLSLKKTAK